MAILTDTCAFPASQLCALAARGKWAGPGMVGPPLINTQVHSTSLPAHKMLPGVIASRSCQCRKNLTRRQARQLPKAHKNTSIPNLRRGELIGSSLFINTKVQFPPPSPPPLPLLLCPNIPSVDRSFHFKLFCC